MAAVAMEGWLLKRGQMGTAKRRYFVLEGKVLAYFGGISPEERQVARGQLVLGPDARVVEATGRRGFTVSVQRKAWTMTSETNDAEEVSRWSEAVAAAIASCRAAAAAAAASASTQPALQDTAMVESDDGRYVATVSGTEFLLDRRYESIRPLGHGAYGVVVSALDRQTGARVAIKKCPNVFEDPLDAKRIAREIRLLRHFHHPNIIKITDLMAPAQADFADVYMVAELMDTDLHRVIYSGQRLTEEHVQFFLYQLLCGIRHIHSADVIHRDLKPSNILLNENCDLKICDFGLARDMGADKPGSELPSNLTEYVVTRWYRAPEVMLSSQEYSKAIDMWGAGCIFGEMLGRKPMFPGNDYIHQLKLITRTIGSPSEADLWFVKNPKAKTFMLQLPPCPPQDLAKRFPAASPDALDLLARMLQLDYKKRATVDAALAHPYFASVRDPAMEFVSPSPVPWGDIERLPLTRPNLQRTVLEDVVAFHPEARPLLDEHRARASAGAGAGGKEGMGEKGGGVEGAAAMMQQQEPEAPPQSMPMPMPASSAIPLPESQDQPGQQQGPQAAPRSSWPAGTPMAAQHKSFLGEKRVAAAAAGGGASDMAAMLEEREGEGEDGSGSGAGAGAGEGASAMVVVAAER